MDALNVQVVQSIFAVEEAEQLVCGPVVQLLACIRVDMRHHQIHLILCKIFKGCTFRKYSADELMGYFNAAFLAGTLRVAVENKRPAIAVLIELDRGRIRKFTASVTIMPNSG